MDHGSSTYNSSAEQIAVTYNSSAERITVNQGGVTSDSSNIPTADGNNVSFVNITYTIQPKSIAYPIRKLPPTTILNDVRYVKIIVP